MNYIKRIQIYRQPNGKLLKNNYVPELISQAEVDKLAKEGHRIVYYKIKVNHL